MNQYHKNPSLPPLHELVQEVLTPEILDVDADPETGRRAAMRVVRRYLTTATGVSILMDAVASRIAGFGDIRLDLEYRLRHDLSQMEVRTARRGLKQLADATGWFELHVAGRNPAIVHVTDGGVLALRSIAMAAGRP